MISQDVLRNALTTLLSELVDGGVANACFVLNPSDPGLLRSLDRLTAEESSAISPQGGASIAAHVDHLCYGMELLNRWADGDERAFETADYSVSWRRTTVTDSEWSALRSRLRMNTMKLGAALQHVQGDNDLHVTGGIAMVVHLAYHFGAIRQIDRSIRGPQADGVSA
jgi:hypothetical protein